MRAFISDVHGNLEALQAVLDDIARHGVAETYCLGDVVGYGPNPRECLDLVMKCKLTILGNHDQGAVFDPPGFNPTAEKAILWTRKQLDTPIPNRQARDLRWEFLAERPRRHREGTTLFVHGSPRNPLNEYIFPEDIYNLEKMESLFKLVERHCFHGHTHIPGIITESLEYLSPEDLEDGFRLDTRKVFCNVGSVGQPRDGNPRACYVLLDGDSIRYRRVEYDFEVVAKKIYEVQDLDKFLGDRLRKGR